MRPRAHHFGCVKRDALDGRATFFAQSADELASILVPFRVISLYASPFLASKYWPGPGVPSPKPNELLDDFPLICHVGAR